MYVHTVLLWCESITRNVMSLLHHTDPHIDHDQSMADKFSIVTYASGLFTTWWGFVTSQEGGIFAGIVIGAATLAVTVYFKMKDEKRKREIHQLKIAQLLAATPEQEEIKQE